MMADVRSVIGARVRITTTEGSYEGTVHNLDQQNRKLTLTKVVLCSSGKNLHGFHNFYGDELNDLVVIEQKTASTMKDKGREGAQSLKESNAATERAPSHSSTQKSDAPQQRSSKGATQSTEVHREKAGLGRGRGLLDKALQDAGITYKPGVKKLSTQSRVTRDASDEGPSLLPREPVAASKYLDSFFDDADEDDSLVKDDGAVLSDPPQVIVLDSFGNKFENAVKFISRQRVIGVGCEGVNLDRFGKLCWLVVGCRQFIYLFDVVSLGASCFDEGIGGILQSANVLKVFHDCRQPSDILHHQYGIRLVNVFDTQVADALIYRNETGGEMPRYVNPLVACLYEYLNLSSDQCHFQKVRRKFMQSNTAIWEERPLPDRLLDATAKHVMYLRELRLVQMERLMAEFVFGVDIYLSVVRDAAPSKKQKKGQLLPPDFKKLDRFKVRHRHRAYDGEYADEVPSAGGSSNSVWNDGAQFAERYQNKPGRVKERVHDGFDATVAALAFENFQSASDSESSVKETESEAFGDVTSAPARRSEGTFQHNYGINGVDKQRLHHGTEHLPKPLVCENENRNPNRSEYFGPPAADTKYYGRVNGESSVHNDQLRGSNSSVPRIHPDMTLGNSNPNSTKSNNLSIKSSVTPLTQAIFHQSDFPPLSSSDSECGTTPPRSSARFPSSNRETAGSPPMLRGHRETRQPVVVQPPRLFSGVEYSGPPGRGRARNLFNNMSQPPARLPAEDGPVDFRTLKMRGFKFNFPRDEELLAASEVVPVANPHGVSGTRVRLRET